MQSTSPVPTYSACPKLVVVPEISTIEINWTSLKATKLNHTSSSALAKHELAFPEGEAPDNVPEVVSKQDWSVFTTASIDPLQLSFAGGQENNWIALLLITQLTSWSFDTVITISVRNG